MGVFLVQSHVLEVLISSRIGVEFWAGMTVRKDPWSGHCPFLTPQPYISTFQVCLLWWFASGRRWSGKNLHPSHEKILGGACPNLCTIRCNDTIIWYHYNIILKCFQRRLPTRLEWHCNIGTWLNSRWSLSHLDRYSLLIKGSLQLCA